MIAAVATWKFQPAHMAYIPDGGVFMAQGADGKPYSKPVPDSEKSAVLELLESVSNGDMKSRVDKLTTSIKDKAKMNLSEGEIKELIVKGTLTKEKSTITLDAKFLAFCYGACTNPSVGIEFGQWKMTSPGKPSISGEVPTVQETKIEGQSLSFGET